MLPFFAIVRHTCRSAIRSNVFRTLLFLLALTVILIPNTIKGDGTAAGFIQLILEYSLGFSGAILAISVAWVCCSEIASDVENGQIHLILVKPVSRPVVLLGKFTGVLVIHTVLLVLASAVIYGFVMYQFMRQDFPAEERQRVENEVLTGRRLIAPDKPDFTQKARAELEMRRKSARSLEERAAIERRLAGDGERMVLAEIERELRLRNGEVEPRGTIFWSFSGISGETPDPLFLRYKLYAGTDGSKNQETTSGAWLLRIVTRTGGTDAEPEYTDHIASFLPEEILTKTRQEFGIQDTILRMSGAPEDLRRNVPPELMKSLTDQLVKNGTFVIGFCNYDRSKKIIFPEVDGPYLMVRETGFLNNYLRAVFVLFLGILAVALVSSALAAYFTLPTSIFLAASYGLLCIFAVYLQGTFAEMDAASLTAGDKLAQLLSQCVFFLLIPFRDFFMTSELATGQLIEFSRIGQLLFYDILLRGIPLFLVGMLLYTLREVSLAMKR